MIAALCKLNKDDFGNKILMNRLFHLPKSKFIITAMVLIYLKFECIFQETHTIVISYDYDPPIPGALYGQSHTCFLLNLAVITSSSLETLSVSFSSKFFSSVTSRLSKEIFTKEVRSQ